jgi:hypothetical protein
MAGLSNGVIVDSAMLQMRPLPDLVMSIVGKEAERPIPEPVVGPSQEFLFHVIENPNFSVDIPGQMVPIQFQTENKKTIKVLAFPGGVIKIEDGGFIVNGSFFDEQGLQYVILHLVGKENEVRATEGSLFRLKKQQMRG